MDRQYLINRIINIGKRNNINNQELVELEKLVEEYLQYNSDDEEIWFRLILLEFHDPIGDYYKCLELLSSFEMHNKPNYYSILLRSFIEEWYLDGLSEKAKAQLYSFDFADNEKQSIALYIIACSYFYTDKDKYEELLRKSIEINSFHVNNLIDFGNYTHSKGNLVGAQKYYKKAIENIKFIFPEIENEQFLFDCTDINVFIDERLKGTYITKGNFDSLKEKIYLN